MAWKFRVMKHVSKITEEEYLAIHRTYMNKEGQIWGWSEEASIPFGDPKGKGVKEMRWELNRMLEATKLPILDYDMEPEGKAPFDIDYGVNDDELQ